jgi:hypothetical protein
LHVTMSALDDNPIRITLAPDKEPERAFGPKAEEIRGCLLLEFAARSPRPRPKARSPRGRPHPPLDRLTEPVIMVLRSERCRPPHRNQARRRQQRAVARDRPGRRHRRLKSGSPARLVEARREGASRDRERSRMVARLG